MKSGNYVPDHGDLVWIDFHPQTGHEQSGHRPAIVLSPKLYNSKTGLGMFCPITSKIKNLVFEVKIKTGKISGVILSDHIKNLDWTQRNIKYIGKANKEAIRQTINNINMIINPHDKAEE